MLPQSYTIEIIIAPDGTTKTTVKGIKGPKCKDVSAWLDTVGKVTHDSETPEFRQVDNQQVTRSTGR